MVPAAGTCRGIGELHQQMHLAVLPALGLDEHASALLAPPSPIAVRHSEPRHMSVDMWRGDAVAWRSRTRRCTPEESEVLSVK